MDALSNKVLLTILCTSEDDEVLEEVTRVLEARWGVGVTERTAELFTSGRYSLDDMLRAIDADDPAGPLRSALARGGS